MIRTKYWLASALLVISSWLNPCLAEEKPDESVTLTLSGQLETSIHRFGQAPRRVLWLSTAKTQEADFELAKQLAKADLEIWLTSPEAKTKKEQTSKTLSAAALAELIEESLPSKSEQQLYIFSTGASAKAAVEALKAWQDVRGNSTQLAGLVLAYPHLKVPQSKGTAPEFIDAVHQLKLPVYVFQPAKKLKVEVAEALVASLEAGGSVVYSEVVNDVADGYLQRTSQSEEETLQTSVFPAQFAQALDKLAETSLKSTTQDDKATTAIATETAVLQEHPTKELAPDLQLSDLEGKTHDLKDYRGKIVLLNFWATWCPPCIKEIPSINNLQNKYSKEDFVVLSVDMGEEPKDIKAFLEHVPAEYPVLLDTNSSLASTWQLHAFPSTYIIDRTGHLRYMYFGGLEWDEPEITSFLEKNLELMAK